MKDHDSYDGGVHHAAIVKQLTTQENGARTTPCYNTVSLLAQSSQLIHITASLVYY